MSQTHKLVFVCVRLCAYVCLCVWRVCSEIHSIQLGTSKPCICVYIYIYMYMYLCVSSLVFIQRAIVFSEDLPSLHGHESFRRVLSAPRQPPHLST